MPKPTPKKLRGKSHAEAFAEKERHSTRAEKPTDEARKESLKLRPANVRP